MSTEPNRQRLPLAGVRVLELSHIVAGPSGGVILGDMGADVIKIEHPDNGDTARGMANGGSTFYTFNRNKKYLALDLRVPSGKKIFAELGEEQFQVGLVVPVAARPAGGEDAGGAVQDVDAEAGVVGDGGEAGGAGEGVGLQQRVLGEGDAGFLDVGDVRVGVRADEVVGQTGVGEDGLELGELAGVAGGEDQAGHAPQYRDPRRPAPPGIAESSVRFCRVTTCRPSSVRPPRR